MERFLKRHEGRIKGIITGFDRILFRGTLRSIGYSQGLKEWLWSEGVPLTEFAPFAEEVSLRLKENARAIAVKAGRPFQHILSPKASKEDIARSIMERDGIRKGMEEENSIKMYDKQGCVLRIETAINNRRRWRVWRRATRKGKRVRAWVPMRKGVMDMRRRAELFRAANERYLEALSVVGDTLPSHKVLDPVSRRLGKDGRPYRALRPISPEDAELLRSASDGQFKLHGFRNRDLRAQLNLAPEKDERTRRRNGARISRTIRLLRAQGMAAKISRSHRYRVTARGHQVIATATGLREINALAFAG